MSLEGRVAVVTGGAGHIGSVVADGLAEIGATIAIVDLEGAGAKKIAAGIATRWNKPAVGFDIDLERTAEIPALVKRVRDKFERIDIIVNSAALVGTSDLEGWAVPFEKQSIETWRRAFEVNLTAPFALVQAASDDLRKSGRGSVVNIASTYGLTGPDWRLYEDTKLGNPAAYAASKGGLIQLTRWLATTLAPDIRVNAIAPGGILRDTAEPFLSRYQARTPLARMGSETDVKGAVAFLASDLSSYVTGQCLAVDGGWTAW